MTANTLGDGAAPPSCRSDDQADEVSGGSTADNSPDGSAPSAPSESPSQLTHLRDVTAEEPGEGTEMVESERLGPRGEGQEQDPAAVPHDEGWVAPPVLGPPPKTTGAPGPPLPVDDRHVADTCVDGFDSEFGHGRAASVRGNSHRHYGEVRQDSVLCSSVIAGNRRFEVLAVADGVGSARKSHIGSDAALRRLGTELQSALVVLERSEHWPHVAREMVTRLSKALEAEAESRNLHAADLATTLLAVIVPEREGHGGREAYYLAVGDGAILRLRRAAWQWLTGTAGEEALTTSGTEALPADTPEVLAGTVHLQPGDVVIAATDGFSGLLNVAEASDFYAREWGATPPHLSELGWQLDSRIKSYDDDRSIAAWWEGRQHG